MAAQTTIMTWSLCMQRDKFDSHLAAERNGTINKAMQLFTQWSRTGSTKPLDFCLAQPNTRHQR